MSLLDEQKLAEALRRGRLTPAEEADVEHYLASHPEVREEWNDELSLNHLLAQTPDMPISSNFTRRVMEAVQHELPTGRRSPGWRRFVPYGWFPRFATVAAVACVGLMVSRQHQLAERRELARNLAPMSSLADGPSIEFLQNFDAIQRLNQVPMDVDRELIAALK